MTDRELLELAAKAAGIVYKMDAGYVWIYEQELWTCWDPLTDDGDALRLAVKLDIRITPGYEGSPYSVAEWWVRPDLITLDHERELVDGDRSAATRRAIVKAAAEIGRGHE